MLSRNDGGRMITKDRIKAFTQEIGFHACGFARPKPISEAEEALRNWSGQGKHGGMKYLADYDARKDQFWRNLERAKSVIVLGVNYFSHPKMVPLPKVQGSQTYQWKNEPCTFGRGTTGRVARYAWGKDYHKVISTKLEALKERIKEEAGRPILFESAVDTKPLLERTVAQQAGLGFIGKQTQLLSLQFGPWLFLSELVTDLEFEPDVPFQGSCGTCRLCIDECPTDAIEEAGHIDARKCIAYLTIEHKTAIPVELREKIGNWAFGCDECLNVCPYTAKQKETDWRELTEDAGFGTHLHLAELFKIKSNREHEEEFSESPISRANRKQLLRNACVVLGNSGSEEALPLLEKALHDSSELVREHAEWAIERIKKMSSPNAAEQHCGKAARVLVGDPKSGFPPKACGNDRQLL